MKDKSILWKHKKWYICFVVKVAMPILFSNFSLHRIEINYERMTILWTYYRAVESFFMMGEEGGGWVKMSVGDKKYKKNTGLKRLKAVPKKEIEGLKGGWIIYLRQLAVLASWNVLQFFILIETFWNFKDFPDNLDFKGKIVAKFFIRIHFLSM